MNTTQDTPEFIETQRILVKLQASVGNRYEILWENKADLLATWQKSVETSEALKDMKARNALDMLVPKTKSLSKLFAYLGLVESLGVTLMDMALILLIANGHEMHIRSGGLRHVSTLKELRKLNLGYKLEFLGANKLGFVAGIVNSQLRNDIAHLKFTINDNGEIRGSNNQVVNIDDVLSGFWDRVGQVIAIFNRIGFLQFIQQAGETVGTARNL